MASDKQTKLRCTYEDHRGIECGAPVPKENDHSGRKEMPFFDFVSHGLCKKHAEKMKQGAVDPEILKIMVDRHSRDRHEARCMEMERRESGMP